MKSQAYLFKKSIPNVEPETIKKHIELIGESHEIVEVRLLPLVDGNKENVKIGIFDNLQSLIDQVQLHNKTHNAYIGLNPRKPILAQSKALNVLNKAACNAEHISKIENLLIDIEALKPDAGLAASDEEIKKARLVFEAVKDLLMSRGIAGLEAESGNGFHIIVGCTPYEATSENEKKVKSLLSYLGTLFTGQNGKIDESVFDLARISRLYGSVNKKGMNTIERPWRTSKILESSGYHQKHDIFLIFENEIKQFMEFEGKPHQHKYEKHPDIVGLFQMEDV